MPAHTTHSFRYESDLCSLAEGQTLKQWRRDEQLPAPGRAAERRGRRRLRLRGRRSAG